MLEKLYLCCDGKNWKNDGNWNTSALVNTWHGISINSTGHIIKIDLSDNDLNGNLPEELNLLTYLEVLNIQNNKCYGKSFVYLNLIDSIIICLFRDVAKRMEKLEEFNEIRYSK